MYYIPLVLIFTVFVILVPAKSRVALLKELSIPEFELLGKLILTRPIHQLMAKMKCSKWHWLKQRQKTINSIKLNLQWTQPSFIQSSISTQLTFTCSKSTMETPEQCV